MGGVENARLDLRAEGTGRIDIPAQKHIRYGQALAALQIAAFTLVGRGRAAP